MPAAGPPIALVVVFTVSSPMVRSTGCWKDSLLLQDYFLCLSGASDNEKKCRRSENSPSR